MPTNEERKEVAEALHELTQHGAAVPVWHAHLILGLIDDNNYVHGTVLTNDSVVRLADLIEPEHERTCCNVETPAGVDVDPEFFRCSKCGCEVMLRTERWVALYGGKMNYCPNCGAKVIEESEKSS